MALTELAPEIRLLLEDLVDDDPCSYDHHGHCQAHSWSHSMMEDGPEGECPHARAKRILSQLPEVD